MMGRVKISSNCGEESTNVSNIFIDEYMQDANDAQIKIYLFLLRMMNANLPTSVTALADKFNHTESDVLRSLKYWENKGLISLEYDTAQNLTGIHMEDIVTKAERNYGRRKDDIRETPVSASIPTLVSSSRPSQPQQYPLQTDKQEEQTVPQKPNYSASQLKTFEESSGSSLLFLAESYYGRPLTTTEMSTVYYIHDELQFSEDLLDYLMQYCAGNNKKDFRYMEKVAINWNQKGIKTPKQARAEIYRHDSDIITIMRALGMENSPTEKEGTFISKWLGELGFTMEIILEACDRTVMAVQRNRLKYCDGILRSWHESKVVTREDIARLDASFTADLGKKKGRSAVTNSNGRIRLDESSIRSGVERQNSFNNFAQNAYDFHELEKVLLDN